MFNKKVGQAKMNYLTFGTFSGFSLAFLLAYVTKALFASIRKAFIVFRLRYHHNEFGICIFLASST